MNSSELTEMVEAASCADKEGRSEVRKHYQGECSNEGDRADREETLCERCDASLQVMKIASSVSN